MPKLKPEQGTIEGAEWIKDLARLELEPGDAIVVRTKARIRPEFGVYLKKQLSAVLPGVKVIVLDGEIDLFVLRPAEAEPKGGEDDPE
jgi:hypothetical protein